MKHTFKVGDLVRDTERGDIGVITNCCNDEEETSYEVVFPTETVLLADAYLELL
tara:strand:+ start:1441 stop:1602 length:162 start_codon:yes stop_codon:yes gene_type:complete